MLLPPRVPSPEHPQAVAGIAELLLGSARAAEPRTGKQPEL